MYNIEGYLPAGTYTTDDTISVMQKYAAKDSTDPKIQKLAAKITAKIHPSDVNSTMLACRNWVLQNMTFVKDPNEAKRLFGIPDSAMQNGELEMVKSPVVTLETRRYDCDCISSFLSALLLALGVTPRLVVVCFHPISITGPDAYQHVFCQGYDPAQKCWIVLDPVSHPKEKEMLGRIKQYKIYDF